MGSLDQCNININENVIYENISNGNFMNQTPYGIYVKHKKFYIVEELSVFQRNRVNIAKVHLMAQ